MLENVEDVMEHIVGNIEHSRVEVDESGWQVIINSLKTRQVKNMKKKLLNQ